MTTTQNITNIIPIENCQLGIREEDKAVYNNLSYSEREQFLQQKADEIQKQIDEIRQKKDGFLKNTEDSEFEIGKYESEHLDLKLHIKEMEDELKRKGILTTNKENPFVKEIELLRAQVDVKKEIIENLKTEESKNIENINALEAIADQLKEQLTVLNGERELNEEIDKTNSQVGSIKDSQNSIIPWNDLKAYGLSKESLDYESIWKLENGEATKIFPGRDGVLSRLRIVPNPLTNLPKISLETRAESPEFQELQETLNLNDGDIENLKNIGILDHAITIKGDNGTEKKVLLFLDRDMNRFYTSDMSKMKIDKAINNNLNKEQRDNLKNGIPVHMLLIDKKGQKYSGWIIADPKEMSFKMTKELPKFVDKEYKIQVANNNHGGRAETVEYDKDAVLKTKQNVNDDGIPTKTPGTNTGKEIPTSNEGNENNRNIKI